MKRSLRRLVTVGATTAVALGLAVSAPLAAHAATSLGSLTLDPATGDANQGITIKSSANCPSTSVAAAVSINGGPNNWADYAGLGPLLVGNQTVNTNFSGGVPAGATIQGAALASGLALVGGTTPYTVQLLCFADTDGIALDGTFDGRLTLTADTTKPSGFRFAMVVAGAPASATTVSGPATAAAGTSVTLSSTVTATGLGAGVTTAGTVAFKDGSTTLATVPVSGLTNAAAGVTVTTPATFTTGGAHTITAAFTLADATIVAASTSAAATVTVSAAAVATTTTLAAGPTAPTTSDVITLTATVTPAAAGTVTFKEGATTVGIASTNTSGIATTSITGASAATHAYTASFVPTDATAFIGSTTATATSVTVTAFAGYSLNGASGGGESITATVASGTLTLTAATTSVNLGTLALNATNDRLVNTAAASLNPVTITDTRAGQVGYTVSGIAGDLTAGSNKINSENLGWTPAVSGTVPASIHITPGPAVASGDGVPAGASSSPVAGLKASRVLATSSYDAATNKGSVGTVAVTATLSLKAPTTTLPGVYSTTLVITAI